MTNTQAPAAPMPIRPSTITETRWTALLAASSTDDDVVVLLEALRVAQDGTDDWKAANFVREALLYGLVHYGKVFAGSSGEKQAQRDYADAFVSRLGAFDISIRRRDEIIAEQRIQLDQVREQLAQAHNAVGAERARAELALAGNKNQQPNHEAAEARLHALTFEADAAHLRKEKHTLTETIQQMQKEREAERASHVARTTETMRERDTAQRNLEETLNRIARALKLDQWTLESLVMTVASMVEWEKALTPKIDALKQEALVFEQAGKKLEAEVNDASTRLAYHLRRFPLMSLKALNRVRSPELLGYMDKPVSMSAPGDALLAKREEEREEWREHLWNYGPRCIEFLADVERILTGKLTLEEVEGKVY